MLVLWQTKGPIFGYTATCDQSLALTSLDMDRRHCGVLRHLQGLKSVIQSIRTTLQCNG